MRHKWLDQELSQDTINGLDAYRLAGTLLDPLSGFRPCFVQSKETALASTLDQLIRLCDKLGTGLQQPWVVDLGLVEDVFDVVIVAKV